MAKWRTNINRVSKEDRVLRIVAGLLYLTCSIFKIVYADMFVLTDDESTGIHLICEGKEKTVADSYKIIKNKEKK